MARLARLVPSWYPGALPSDSTDALDALVIARGALTAKPRVCGAFDAVGDGAVTVIVGG